MSCGTIEKRQMNTTRQNEAKILKIKIAVFVAKVWIWYKNKQQEKIGIISKQFVTEPPIF